MTALLAESGFTPDSIEAEFQFNREQVIAVRDDTWTSISRAELQVYFSLALRHGVDFAPLPIHPAWQTFDKPALVFSSRDVAGSIRPCDLEAERVLRNATGFAGKHVDAPPTRKTVVDAIKGHNCLFIGSPRNNPATSHALNYLWPSGATPPFIFQFKDWTDLGGTGAFGSDSPDGGMGALVVRGAKRDFRLAVTHQAPNKVGYDFGALVVCRQPRDAKADVTTIILAGHSGFATADMARDLAHGTVFVDPTHIRPGQPFAKILAAHWKRRGHNIERATKGRMWAGLSDMAGLLRMESKIKE
jgi:hypothetical protein